MYVPQENRKNVGRLRKRPEFLEVRRYGLSKASKGMILQAAPNNAQQIRFGITITKKVFKSAVKRNRIRRRLRALAYEILPVYIKNGYDVVLIGRAETLDRSYEELKGDLKWCLRKLDLYGDPL